MILKQHQFSRSEQYIKLTADVVVKGNVLPAPNILESYFEGQETDIHQLFHIIGERQFESEVDHDIDLSTLALVKATAKFKYRSWWHKRKWLATPGAEARACYKDDLLRGDRFPPILLTHPGVLRSYFGVEVSDSLYQVDGAHRIFSALAAGLHELDAYVIVNRTELAQFISQADRARIVDQVDKCTWFPRYQEMREVGLEGRRQQGRRYTEIYDFSIVRDKTVVDFGGNTGQAALEACFQGAGQTCSFDVQPEAIDTARVVVDVLGLDIEHNTLDFNEPSYKQDIKDVVDGWDWAIFQAIYRTKEIKDTAEVFDHIVANTREGIFFEGNGDPELDTDEFYQNIFKRYPFKSIEYLGHCDKRPAYLLKL